MLPKKLFPFVTTTLACSLFLSFLSMARAQAPDTILINGKVLTVDAQDNVVQAVAIANGKITAVGTTADIQRRAGPATRVIDLHGLTATPGLIDTHAHMLWIPKTPSGLNLVGEICG